MDDDGRVRRCRAKLSAIARPGRSQLSNNSIAIKRFGKQSGAVVPVSMDDATRQSEFVSGSKTPYNL